MTKGLHSIGFIAACRVAWLVGYDPHQPRRRVLSQLKNNLDPPQPSLAYTITSHSSGAARLEWHGPTSWSSDDLCSASGTRRRVRQRAEEFLSTFLKDGPRTSRDIWGAAKKFHLSSRTLRRARKDLDIKCRRTKPFTGSQLSYWLLPGQQLPADAHDPETAELDAWLHRLGEQFPPRTPLDDDEPRRA